MLNLYSTPEPGYFIPTEREALYVHVLFALRDRNLGMLEGNFVFLIYNMFVFMERHWQTLLKDVRDGTITEEFPIPAEFREKLRPFHPAMPTRAAVCTSPAI